MSVIDIDNIKTQFKSILDTANTTTADFDLSNGLDKRVKKVLRVNPLKIPIQSSYYPYVTIYADRKNIELLDIAVNQQTANRFTEFTFNVIGGVFEALTASNIADDADDEIEKLMENVEELIRRNFKLNNTVLWTKPLFTRYHTFPDEEALLRVGEMSLMCKIKY